MKAAVKVGNGKSFTVELWPIGRPIPYAKNARKLSASAVDKVALSLREFGFRQPIVVDASGVVVVGHTRLAAAKRLGMTEVPVHVAAGLTAAQVKAYRLMDNRSNQETDWDLALLGDELAELVGLEQDLALTGFNPDEIDALLRVKGEGLTGDDEVPAPPEVAVSAPGDMWLLGRHRLLCGDSTSIDAMARLMGAEKAGMVFTDPPYNVDYDAGARPGAGAGSLGKIMNDHMPSEAFRSFLDSVYSAINGALLAGRAIYICHADTQGHHFRNAFIAQPWKLQSCLIWKKTVLVFGRADYHWMHEPILMGEKDGEIDGLVTHDPVLYGWKEGARHQFHGGRKQTTVWEIPTDNANKADADTKDGYVHPTQKPVALIVRAVKNSSAAGEAVLDPFGGSGSTAIACEKTGRGARLIELDPKYCDVIVKRWEAFTGQRAVLEGDGRAFSEVAAGRVGELQAAG